jgi:P22_AR N-terminal domain
MENKGEDNEQKQALVPLEERSVDFYGDEVIAVLVEVDGIEQVYVPIRPVCTYLGLSTDGQRQRIQRNRVLSKKARIVHIGSSKMGGSPDMICVPLDMLNGWLFGVDVNRVKESLQEKVLLYQEECYRILAEAFQLRTAMTPAQSASITVLEQLRDYGLALAQLATDQIEMEKKMAHQGERLDKAALVVGDIVKRLKYVERRVAPGAIITEEQAMVLSQTVKALAELLTERDAQKKNYHQSIFGELYRRYGITNYKVLPIDNFEEAIQFLEDWRKAALKIQQLTEGQK